jgi:hypothetical protein
VQPSPILWAAQAPMCWRRRLPLHLGRQDVKVRCCARCPYTPRDLADHYDANGKLHVCARCDSYLEASTNHYPRKPHRRQGCATVVNIFGTVQPSVARSVTDDSALSDAIPAERRSVQRSASPASHVAKKMTADGYVVFRMPDNGQCEKPVTIVRRLALANEEVTQ